MPSNPSEALGLLLRRLFANHGRGRLAPRDWRRAAAGARRSRARSGSLTVQRDLDSFRRSQGLPYWHHDHRSR